MATLNMPFDMHRSNSRIAADARLLRRQGSSTMVWRSFCRMRGRVQWRRAI